MCIFFWFFADVNWIFVSAWSSQHQCRILACCGVGALFISAASVFVACPFYRYFWLVVFYFEFFVVGRAVVGGCYFRSWSFSVNLFLGTKRQDIDFHKKQNLRLDFRLVFSDIRVLGLNRFCSKKRTPSRLAKTEEVSTRSSQLEFAWAKLFKRAPAAQLFHYFLKFS